MKRKFVLTIAAAFVTWATLTACDEGMAIGVPEDWTEIGSSVIKKCDGTTMVYVHRSLGGVAVVPNAPECASPKVDKSP